MPKILIKLLAKYRGFKRVEDFDSHDVPPLLSEEYVQCWSLPLVTLTTITMSLPNIQKKKADLLLSGVREGLVYVTHVEESLNTTDDHLSIQKATKILWVEVEIYHKRLGNRLPQTTPQAKTTRQTLQWFRDTSESNYMCCDNYEYKSISANSMYRITETILRSYHESIDQVSQEELFVKLRSMIADILAACLTNLPQVIAMKCHTSAIEKREASVYAAAQLLRETAPIIYTFQEHVPKLLNPDELAFIDNWRAYSMHHFP